MPKRTNLNPVTAAVARVASASREPIDETKLREARNALLAATLKRDIDDALNPDPPYEPLASFDRVRLASYLATGRMGEPGEAAS